MTGLITNNFKLFTLDFAVTASPKISLHFGLQDFFFISDQHVLVYLG